MSTENEDLSESLAAELTGSLGLQEDGSGDMSDGLANDLADQEQHLAERDIPVSNDVQDTAQGELDREAERSQSQKRGSKVPLAALHEERTRRQQAEQTVAQLQAQYQQLVAQQQAAQQQQLQAQQEAAIPDFDEDPRGHIEAVKQQFQQQLDQLQNGPAQQQQVQIAQQFEAQVMQDAAVLGPAIADAEIRFEAAHPDYRQAFDHVQQSVEGQLRAMYPQASEAQFGMLRTAALVAYTKQCQASGVSPCEHIYQRAQQLGFKAARQAPPVAPTSLSYAGGAARAPDERSNVSVSDISSMTEKEFDAYWSSMKSSAAVKPAF